MLWMTTGTFDAPHMAQATLLARCRDYTDTMMVGVLSDSFVEQYKGERPQWTEHERLLQVRYYGDVLFDRFDCHIIDDQAEYIMQYHPVVIAVGSDWHGGQMYLDQLGISQEDIDHMQIAIMYFPRTPGISTTEIKRRLASER